MTKDMRIYQPTQLQLILVCYKLQIARDCIDGGGLQVAFNILIIVNIPKRKRCQQHETTTHHPQKHVIREERRCCVLRTHILTLILNRNPVTEQNTRSLTWNAPKYKTKYLLQRVAISISTRTQRAYDKYTQWKTTVVNNEKINNTVVCAWRNTRNYF